MVFYVALLSHIPYKEVQHPKIDIKVSFCDPESKYVTDMDVTDIYLTFLRLLIIYFERTCGGVLQEVN